MWLPFRRRKPEVVTRNDAPCIVEDYTDPKQTWIVTATGERIKSEDYKG